MFGFGRRKMGYGVKQDDRWGDYSGEDIWAPCPDCGVPHQVDVTADFRDLLEEQCSAIGDSSAATYEEFHIAEPDGRWNVVPEQARFTFTRENGQQCHARYGVIGSYNSKSHSWMWAWEMPEDWMPAPATAVAHQLRALGNENSWDALCEPMLLINEHEAWHMAKLGAWLAGYPMVYRAPVNELNHHYFAIDRPVWLT